MKMTTIIGASVGAVLGVMWMNKRKAKKEAEKAQQDEKWAKEQKSDKSGSPE